MSVNVTGTKQCCSSTRRGSCRNSPFLQWGEVIVVNSVSFQEVEPGVERITTVGGSSFGYLIDSNGTGIDPNRDFCMKLRIRLASGGPVFAGLTRSDLSQTFRITNSSGYWNLVWSNGVTSTTHPIIVQDNSFHVFDVCKTGNKVTVLVDNRLFTFTVANFPTLPLSGFVGSGVGAGMIDISQFCATR